MSKPRRGPVRRALRAALALTLITALGALAIETWVARSVAARVHAPDAAPQHAVIVVLGASVLRDGTPSPMLQQRIDTAAALWRAGRAPLVLVSGDYDPVREYDETEPMRDALVRAGVTWESIRVDRHGHRTLDSMVRVREEFGFDDALVVTNGFHVARAVYLGRHHGLDVDGVIADVGVDRAFSVRAYYVGREALARILAFFDCHVLGTRPPKHDERD
ncbi:MAG: YdcF family protein [Planctomycetota bacterium]|nr:YdcF family protein [Planctomycetota bacterium]